MTDGFVDFADLAMSRATDPLSPPATSSPEPKLDGHVCPFCGLMREITEDFDPATPCPRCTLADTPTTRNATKARIGPWHVRQVRNPWAPGMRFDTLIALIKRGQVNKDSIVRGPTSHQLWKRAAEVKGLSREFGLCYSCGREVSMTANLCPHCNRLQEPPANPDLLVETRDSFVPPAAAAPAAIAPAVAPARAPAPIPPPAAPLPIIDHDVPEPAPIEMGSKPMTALDPVDMLAVTQDPEQVEMARQIAARPPAKQRMSLRPRTPGADDALLTPQELAAAFQLDFSPNGGAEARPPEPPARPKRGAGKLVFVLAVIGVAVLLYLRPDYRAQASEWGESAMASIKSMIGSDNTPKLPTMRFPEGTELPRLSPPPPAPPPQSRQTPIEIKPPAPVVSPPVAVAEAPPKPAEPPAPAKVETPAPPKVEAPATANVEAPAAASVEASPATKVAVPPPLVEEAPPAPIPAAVKSSPPPEPIAPAKPAPSQFTDSVSQYEESKRLWIKAIDAEANQDFVEAVSCYEQIKKLPADVHPAGLDVNLDRARKLAK
jgi:hypothetical protein